MPKTKKTRTRVETTSGLPYGASASTGDRPENARQKAKREAAEKLELAQAQAAAAAKEIRDRIDAQRAASPPVAGVRGDGDFHLSFVQMGQGDCTIMSTPTGKIILIDCGTNAQDDETDYTTRVQNELRAKAYLKNRKKIDVVILSHPDKDHYNQLAAMLPQGYGHTVGTVYHSNDLSYYAGGEVWAKALAPAARIKKVVLNRDDALGVGATTLAGAPIAAATVTDRIERLDATGGLVVHSEPDCEVTILAAGVENDYANDKDRDYARNRASIVTLVTAFDTTFVISADATRSTEQFIMDSARAGRVAGADVIQVGHHGSDSTSSGGTWIAHVKPAMKAVVSAGDPGHSSHHLPSVAVVERWIQQFVDDDAPAEDETHIVTAWDTKTALYAPETLEVDQPVYSTGSSGSQNFTCGAES